MFFARTPAGGEDAASTAGLETGATFHHQAVTMLAALVQARRSYRDLAITQATIPRTDAAMLKYFKPFLF
jgi:hypothetical protein